MRFSILILAFAAHLASVVAVPPAPAPSCATGLHMIVARASTEPAGPGIIGGVAKSIAAKVQGSDFESVMYPATLTNYANSEAAGVKAMSALIAAYAAKCPLSKMALLGYSQGAQVVGDSLCGNSAATAALSPDLAKKIVAVVQMGDPSHVVGSAGNVGTSTKNGVFPRKNVPACAPFAALTQSYCDSDDPFCDSGSNTTVHLGYVTKYGTAATDFVVSKVA